jgi:hypothetical protein
LGGPTRGELQAIADKSNFAIAASAYVDADGTCGVETIVERAGTSGPIYSARARCADASGKFHAANLIVRTEDGDKLSMGSTFDDLKIYQRCPAK